MNFFERAAQTLLGGTSSSSSVALMSASPLTASSSGVSDISLPSRRRSTTRSPTLLTSDTEDDVTDTEDDSGIADAHDLSARAKRFFPDLGLSDVAMAAASASGSSIAPGVSPGAHTLNTFLTYWWVKCLACKTKHLVKFLLKLNALIISKTNLSVF